MVSFFEPLIFLNNEGLREQQDRMIPSIENSKRIRILTQSEIKDLYERPEFTEDERK